MFNDIGEILSKEVRRAISPVMDEVVATRETIDAAVELMERFDARLQRYEQILEALEPVLNLLRRVQGKPPLNRQP